MFSQEFSYAPFFAMAVAAGFATGAGTALAAMFLGFKAHEILDERRADVALALDDSEPLGTEKDSDEPERDPYRI